MTYFTSDLHFGHSNIIKLCNRPFADVESMDAALIENWNKKVKKNDTVYVLGDIVWDKKARRLLYGKACGNKDTYCGQSRFNVGKARGM